MKSHAVEYFYGRVSYVRDMEGFASILFRF
jgi:hypothetical protein